MFRVLGIYNFGWGWKCSTPSIASPCHTLVFTGDKVERKELRLERQEILWTYFLLLVAAVLNKILFVKFTATYFRVFNTSFVLMLSIILSWQNTGLWFYLKTSWYLRWPRKFNNQEYWCNGILSNVPNKYWIFASFSCHCVDDQVCVKNTQTIFLAVDLSIDCILCLVQSSLV